MAYVKCGLYEINRNNRADAAHGPSPVQKMFRDQTEAILDRRIVVRVMSDVVVDQIIVGSYHGRLAVYQPHPTRMDEKTRGFNADDVICELQLSAPILQIGTGRFAS